MEGIKKAIIERNLKEVQWEDRKQWSLGVGQHIYIYAFYMFWPLHGHPQGGLQQRSTIMADSVIDVHMWSQNTQCLQ